MAVAYVVFLAVFVKHNGVPTGTTVLMTFVMIGLAIACVGRGPGSILRILADWLPFALVLGAYDISRTVVHAVGMPLHEVDVASAEQRLFAGVVPSVWLQQHLYTPSTVHWYDAAMTLVYTTHFLATPVLAAVLWLRDRRAWLGYVRRVMVLSLAGLVTYTLFPEAPPWLASRDGVIGPVHRLSARGWTWFHLGDVDHILASAQSDGSNPIAAMPSLHVGFAVLLALCLGSRIRSGWRLLLVLYPVAMGFTLVYTGEHYVLDVIGGGLYAIAVDHALRWWELRQPLPADDLDVPVGLVPAGSREWATASDLG